MNEELAKVVTAIGITDRSINHHQSELERLWALRASLADRIEQLGGTTPVPPRKAPATSVGVSEGQQAADEWLAELDRTGQSPWTPPEQLAPTPMMSSRPEWTQAVQRRKFTKIEVQSLGPIILGEIRYERVLIEAKDIPARFAVWVLEGQVPQAHLKSDISEFKGVADCGVKGPGRWWHPEPDEMEVRVELCRDCAGSITGVVLPAP